MQTAKHCEGRLFRHISSPQRVESKAFLFFFFSFFLNGLIKLYHKKKKKEKLSEDHLTGRKFRTGHRKTHEPSLLPCNFSSHSSKGREGGLELWDFGSRKRDGWDAEQGGGLLVEQESQQGDLLCRWWHQRKLPTLLHLSPIEFGSIRFSFFIALICSLALDLSNNLNHLSERSEALIWIEFWGLNFELVMCRCLISKQN